MEYRRLKFVVLAICISKFWATPSVATEPARVDFNRDVQPILSGHCYKCHGPDDKSREAGVRFDRRDAALAASESGVVPLVPGDPDASELIRHIEASDEAEKMPPAAANKDLSEDQKKILRQWIAEGAEYQVHWSFVPPQQATLPATKQSEWGQNPIDAFILARLEAEGLLPSPPADRVTLARRVSLDLIGLPPTPAEVDAYLADNSPHAYEKYVDRLLALPQYGERWARRWLDLARYADTNGYEKDRPRSMWPYRDWVINALNADMPFDQFTIEQLAGDMLPNASLSQRTATGFHRNTMINEEGGVDPLEFRFHAMVDRVGTTGTVWLGLTIGCAQCHTHKYDPIPHRDYYRLMAFLNNADELVMDVPQLAVAAKRTQTQAQIAAAQAALAEQFPAADDPRWHDIAPLAVQTGGESQAQIQSDGSVLLSGSAPQTDTYTVTLDPPVQRISHLQLQTLTDSSLGAQGPGRTQHGNFVVTEFSAALVTTNAADMTTSSQPIQIAAATVDFAQDGFSALAMLDGQPNTGWAIHGPGPWNVSRTATFQLAEPIQVPPGAHLQVRIDQQYGGQHTLGRFRLRLGESLNDPRPLAARRQENLEQHFNNWLASERARTGRWQLLKPLQARCKVPVLSILEDGSVLATADQTKSDLYELQYQCDLKGITALRLEALPDDRLPERGPGRIYYEGPFGDFYLSTITAGPVNEPFAFASATESFAAGGNTATTAIDADQQTGWSINGAQGRPHSAVFRFAQPVDTSGTLDLQLLFERYYAAGLGRFRIWATTDPEPAPARDLPTTLDALLLTDSGQLTADQRQQLLEIFLTVAPQLAAQHKEIDNLRKQIAAYPTTLVMTERPATNPRATHLHRRGEYLQPDELVTPEVPEIFSPLPADAPHDRLTFARWLVDRQNPLTARVTVNRQWATFFGRGLVRTTEDFGYQGERPTHPELLDWLAVEFMQQGWSLKSLHKLMVTSATYQQSSHFTPELLAADPQNKLLARAPRVRLDAELIRDSILHISGQLSPKLGGPSVFPPQPSGITSEGTYGPLAWKVSEGEDRYRRGLYTFAKRTAPYAMFNTFDAPSGEACVARREISNTPLQALTLLNDDVFLDAARALGKQLAQAGGTADERIMDLFRRCLARPPRADELSLVANFHATQRQRLAAGELNAAQISGLPEGDALDPAAWTLTSRAVLNLDEVITKE
jgi:hypothetical protein